ncbi:MAG: hypothetical protein ABI557_09015, partial [Aureliella sp.]
MRTAFGDRDNVIHRQLIERLTTISTAMRKGFFDFYPILVRQIIEFRTGFSCASPLRTHQDDHPSFVGVIFGPLLDTSRDFFVISKIPTTAIFCFPLWIALFVSFSHVNQVAFSILPVRSAGYDLLLFPVSLPVAARLIAYVVITRQAARRITAILAMLAVAVTAP